MRSEVWSALEVEAVVADYLSMLRKELSGEAYNKSDHRRRLRRLLENRSDGSIERKHQNISAVLIEVSFPYIRGYKPLSNYQALLADVVLSNLEDDVVLEESALRYVEAPAEQTRVFTRLLDRMATPPFDLLDLARVALRNHERVRRARKTDYLAIEANNRRLGIAGERFVVAFERERLASSGFDDLARRVEHVTETTGDGLGFDVLSFTDQGREKFIEVKTTRMGPATPFFVSTNEVRFSDERSDQFSLYRVFTYEADPRLFALNGALRMSCDLSASHFLASPRGTSM